VDAWTFIWLMVFLKIPIVALFLLVRWAIRAEVEPALDEDGGISYEPDRPRHPKPSLPRRPRRGPHHGAGAYPAPPRVRSVLRRVQTVRDR
jgi:hypothetical protein